MHSVRVFMFGAPWWLACLASCGSVDNASAHPVAEATTNDAVGGEEATAPIGGATGGGVVERAPSSTETASGRASEDSERAADPRPTESLCARFDREEARRAAEHRGPCPHCPCACSPERGIVCAPCARCVETGPPVELFEDARPASPP